jgi:hypothetical protein
MTDIFIYALAISTVFFLFKFLEMKMLPDEEKKPLKVIIKESMLVYLASVMGIYMYAQFDLPILKENTSSKSALAFVDTPTF